MKTGHKSEARVWLLSLRNFISATLLEGGAVEFSFSSSGYFSRYLLLVLSFLSSCHSRESGNPGVRGKNTPINEGYFYGSLLDCGSEAAMTIESKYREKFNKNNNK